MRCGRLPLKLIGTRDSTMGPTIVEVKAQELHWPAQWSSQLTSTSTQRSRLQGPLLGRHSVCASLGSPFIRFPSVLNHCIMHSTSRNPSMFGHMLSNTEGNTAAGW